MAFIRFFNNFILYDLDIGIKKSAGKIDDFLGSVLINAAAVLPALIAFAWLKLSGKEIFVTQEGAVWSIVAGLSIGIGTITFVKMYAAGINVSLGSPIIRIGTVILVTLFGLLIFKEVLNIRQILGLIMSVAGLALLVLK